MTVTRPGADLLREALLEHLADRRPRTAGELARLTGRAVLSVRQTLAALEREGRVRITRRSPMCAEAT